MTADRYKRQAEERPRADHVWLSCIWHRNEYGFEMSTNLRAKMPIMCVCVCLCTISEISLSVQV